MKRFVLMLVLATLAASPSRSQTVTPLKLIVFPGGLSWPIFVAQDRGFFAGQKLDVAVTFTPGSVFQMKGILAGDFDIAMTPFDNVVAFQEGQAEVSLPIPPDLFAFMGGIAGTLRLIVQPEITSFAELNGKTLAVDSMSAGYTLLMYKMLDQHGLPLGSYQLERLGGTASRVQALVDGKVAGTMVSSPQEIPLEESGFRRLGDVQSLIGSYQALCGVARRFWATEHKAVLIAFIRAYVAANDWLADPANKSSALQIYQQHILHASHNDAEKAWDVMLSKTEGFQAHAKFDAAGAQMALKVRTQYGVPKRTLDNWHRYVDEDYYKQATARN